MTQPSLNRRLTTIDSTFLYLEKAEQPMHIGGCMLHEGRVSREELARLLLDRLHRLPRYRQKVVFPPFTLAHPTWEDDPDFDIDHHIDEVMLPAPADDRTMAEVGGRVYGGMLDRRHPLWKLILLQGRPDGHTAIVWKIHHAMIDGMSGVDLTMVLHDLTPDAEPPTPPATPWQPRPLPDPITLLHDRAALCRHRRSRRAPHGRAPGHGAAQERGSGGRTLLAAAAHERRPRRVAGARGRDHHPPDPVQYGLHECAGTADPALSGWAPPAELDSARDLCSTGVGLFVAILTYDRRLTFGLTFDPALIADGWEIADHLRLAFAELRSAAEAAQPAAFAGVAAPAAAVLADAATAAR